METDPTELLTYMVSWASLGISIMLLIGTILIRKLIGPWCFFFSSAMHVVWAIQSVVVCVVMAHGLREEMGSVFASNVVFGQITIKLLFLGCVIAFAIENRHR